MKVKSLSLVRFLSTPWTGAYQAPLSMGFSRQEYWSGFPLPSPTPYSRAVSRILIHVEPFPAFVTEGVFLFTGTTHYINDLLKSLGMCYIKVIKLSPKLEKTISFLTFLKNYSVFSDKHLLYSTGNYIQNFVITYNG